MGGNLFKLGRLPRSEYLVIEAELREYLDKKFGENYKIPRYYGDKSDFGDADILLSSAINNDWRALQAEILKDLHITDSISQQRLLSTNYRQFQVDFFFVVEDCFESTYHFLCFNDLGNLLGKIFRRFNLKYGEKGLFYVYRRDEGNYKKDILVSRDFSKILRFLKLSYDEWNKGFESLDQLFRWVIASPYFSVAPYQKLDRVTAQRARKRKTMSAFLDYIKEQQITKTYPFNEDRSVYLDKIVQFFPEVPLTALIGAELEQEKVAEQVRTRFNGQLVMALIPELKGKALGEFIMAFKAQYQDFKKDIIQLNPNSVKAAVLDFHRTYKAS
ncbi:MAG: hypothetical protein P1V97_06005 [Planctomycetota bacterium]|nr:hypothetical protein [Planctomycetota bacterium]